MTEPFVEVTLADFDLPAMMNAVSPLNINVKNKIQLVSTDFTKLEEIDFYHNPEELLDNKASGKKIVDFLDNCAAQLHEIEILTHFKGRFQVVISSALYTQLFYMNALQILAPYVEEYSQEEITAIINGLLGLREVVIQKYNDLLVDLAAPHGVIVVWSDVLKISPDENFKETIDSFSTETEKFHFIMDGIKKNGRIEGIFGLQNMQNRLGISGKLD